MRIELAGAIPGIKSPVILVVDDDLAARLQMRFSLENEGMSVVEAETGLEALDYFRNNQVDLVLLDVVMPGIDGFMTCREIRSLPDGGHVPVVMITGLEDAETIKESFDAGATDFVCKPMNLLILGYRVRYWLRSGAALQALQINQTRLFKAQEIARLGHWEKNLDNGDFQLTCHKPEMFGLSHPCTYEALFAAILAEDAAAARKIIEDACRDGLGFSVQYRISFADGAVRTLVNQGGIIRKGALQTSHAVGIIQDITDSQRAADSLRHSEKKWRAVFERSPVGIALFDNESNIIDCNENFTEIFGVPREHYIGLNLFDKLPHGRMRETLQQALSSEDGVQRWEGLHTSFMSGKEVYLNIVSERVSPDLLVVVLADFSEQRLAMLAQEKMQAQLTQAQKMEAIGRLAGGVAHDFNNMLGVILGRADMVLEQLEPSHPSIDDLREICSAATRSADLTRQLLTFARKQIITPRVLSLNDTVEGMLKMLQRLIGENIELVWRPGKDLWPIKIDPSQIDQILANLCVNARDAIAGVGTITVTTKHASLDEKFCRPQEEGCGGEYVLLTVTDDGCGMDEEILENLFEPFFTTKEMGKGTGLGLATIYGIVRQNHGFINVSSQPKRGTTFSIYLPLYKDTAVPNPKKSQAVVAEGCETIMLVEDEPAILAMITRMVERLGYNVLAASSPTEALSIAAQHSGKIHLLLTDVVMPEMNGRELAEQIRTLRPEIETLFMSGYTADIIAKQGVVDEGLAFIQKPFSKKELAAKLREILA